MQVAQKSPFCTVWGHGHICNTEMRQFSYELVYICTYIHMYICM